MPPMDVFARVRATIDAYHLLAPGGAVVVGVSGGPDSLSLLHMLWRLRRELGLHLHVAHLNHRLRPEAEAEAQFVTSVAMDWGLPYTLGIADVPALVEAEGWSVEEAARVARYRFLALVARGLGTDIVAVGHNADDQVETVLMHCLRGAGLAGLRGMRRRSRLPEIIDPGCPALYVIRPLLDVSRAAIEAYCREQGLHPLLDRTNLEMTYFRNRIRHELVPALETYNPRIRKILHRTADVLADDYDYLQESLDALWPRIVLAEKPDAVILRASELRQLPRSLQRGALRRAARAMRPTLRDIGWLHIERARRAALTGQTGARADLPAGLLLEVSYDRIILRDTQRPVLEAATPVLAGPEREVQVPGRTELAPGGWVLETWVSDQCPQPYDAPDGRLHLCLDADRAGRALRVRTRRPGDRFQPLGLEGHSKSVKDYMIDAKIPRAQRDRIPLLVSEEGILWVAGWRASEVGLPSPQTQRFLCLRLIPPQPETGPEGRQP
jgi:tRNA(Ile)-lysidine synthase